ncbi:hypothetical protein [Paracoccus sp. (in: a-proteobacteria)]|uniref:hypothetical protein n=1 Tax=Paracoccus sp. TaxID=267 RepID=UPI003342A474
MNAPLNLLPVSGYSQILAARNDAIAALERHPHSRKRLGAVHALTHLLLAIETGRA